METINTEKLSKSYGKGETKVEALKDVSFSVSKGEFISIVGQQQRCNSGRMMKMRKNVLDEMQVQKRNKIGNDAFLLLFYLLLAEIGISGFGIKWLVYPVNVFVIMLVSMTYYLVRIIWSGAYVGPTALGNSVRKKTIAVTVAAAMIASVAVFMTQKNFFTAQTDGDGRGAIILFVCSAVAIIIAIIVGIISKRQNHDTDK